MQTTFLPITFCLLAWLVSSPVSIAAQGNSTPSQANSTADPHSVPVIDGGIGPCAADFTVTDNAGKPIYDAEIKVHISYRAFGAHKLDLQVGTNIDGKARFTGLPEKTKQGLFFEASKENRAASAFLDTAKTCKAQFALVLEGNRLQ